MVRFLGWTDSQEKRRLSIVLHLNISTILPKMGNERKRGMISLKIRIRELAFHCSSLGVTVRLP
jgi:hypothetical protein